MKYFFTALILLTANLLLAQEIEKNHVEEDLLYLRDQIKIYNPALPRFHPEFDSRSDSLINANFQEAKSSFQFFSLVSQLCTMANEGHFLLHDWEDKLHSGFANNTYTYMPLQIKIIDKRVYIYGDFSNEQELERGDEIMAINGIKTQEILNTLIKHTPSDGHIVTYAYRKIENRFNLLYYLYLERPEEFELTISDTDGVVKKITYEALTQEKLIENLKEYYPPANRANNEDDEGFYSLSYLDNYAYLKLPSFDYRRVNKYEVKSKQMYKTIFTTLQERGIEHLIIDLRDNTGGRNEFADDMIPFIAKSPIDEPFFKKTISWEGKERVYKSPKSTKLAFKGKLYALVNGKTYSAGSSLARYLKEYGAATVIGEETGTRYEGFAAGSTQYINLPNSGLEIGIPRYLISYPESTKQKTKNRGLLPDYFLENTLETSSDDPQYYIKKVISLVN